MKENKKRKVLKKEVEGIVILLILTSLILLLYHCFISAIYNIDCKFFGYIEIVILFINSNLYIKYNRSNIFYE